MNRRYRVQTLATAEHDIREIALHIAAESPTAGMKFAAQMRATILSLATLPTSWPIIPRTKRFGVIVRRRLLGNYKIYFTIRDQEVLVLHVRHASRRPPTRFTL